MTNTYTLKESAVDLWLNVVVGIRTGEWSYCDTIMKNVGGGNMRIKELRINHFKSIFDLSICPGNVNVIIGSNGAGKSSFLEGIGLLSAAVYERVNDVALQNRGVRLGVPGLYKSSFKKSIERTLTIHLGVKWESQLGNWEYNINLHNPDKNPEPDWQIHSEVLKLNDKQRLGRSNRSKNYSEVDKYRSLYSFLYGTQDKRVNGAESLYDAIKNYGIYAPNTSTLQGIQADTSQRDPLGLFGGRLAESLVLLLKEDKFGTISIDDLLEVLDWVEAMKIGKPSKEIISPSVPTMHQIIKFKDKYMREKNNILTAYDASEGTLYVLFLLALAMHEKAPKIFALDNFDQALNPRLAKQVIKMFSEIIINAGKTVFVTTHNPLVLDGLNLLDERIRLFAMSRDQNGFSMMKRIEISEYMYEKEPLSRLWVTGRLGGVPEYL